MSQEQPLPTTIYNLSIAISNINPEKGQTCSRNWDSVFRQVV